MRVLITGGTGFIGSRLALECLARGHVVRVLGQENTAAEAENAMELRAAGIEVILGSVTDADGVARAVADAENVVHLAAAQHEMGVPNSHYQAVNVQGTRHVVEACERGSARALLYGSTIGVYGGLDTAADGVLDETSPCRPDNVYGRTKLEAERVVLSSADRLSAAVARIPETYGPGDRRLLKLFRAIQAGRFFLIGAGENRHHPMYVDDLVRGFLATLDAPAIRGQLFQFAGKEALTTRQMVQAIAGALDRDPPRLRVPLLPFVAAATLLEWTLRPLGIQPPLHRRRLDFFRKSFELSGAKARAALSFEPEIGFAEGARRTADWYRARGLLDS